MLVVWKCLQAIRTLGQASILVEILVKTAFKMYTLAFTPLIQSSLFHANQISPCRDKRIDHLKGSFLSYIHIEHDKKKFVFANEHFDITAFHPFKTKNFGTHQLKILTEPLISCKISINESVKHLREG